MRLRRAIDNAVGSRAFVLRFLRGKVRGGRFGFPHSVGCSIHNELPFWRRRPRARVDADQSEERADLSGIFSVAQSHPPLGERKSEKRASGGPRPFKDN